MKFSNRILSLVSCAAVLAVAPAANAASVTGYFWNAASSGVVDCTGNNGSATVQGTCSGNQGAVPAVIPSTGTATSSFTLSNPNGPALFNFSSTTDNSLTGFLTTGTNGLPNGDVLSYLTGGNVSNIDNGLFEFTGTTFLTLGQIIHVSNDDGINLYIDGVGVILAGSPPSSGNETWMSTLSGSHAFTLDYVESNAAPAHLTSDILPAPEPNSLMLLGTGVLGAAGMLRRRLLAK